MAFGAERVNVAEAESLPSVAVTRIVRVAGVSSSRAVPLNVRIVGLKVSHDGRSPPSSSEAAYVTGSPSGSVKAGAW